MLGLGAPNVAIRLEVLLVLIESPDQVLENGVLGREGVVPIHRRSQQVGRSGLQPACIPVPSPVHLTLVFRICLMGPAKPPSRPGLLSRKYVLQSTVRQTV